MSSKRKLLLTIDAIVNLILGKLLPFEKTNYPADHLLCNGWDKASSPGFNDESQAQVGFRPWIWYPGKFECNLFL